MKASFPAVVCAAFSLIACEPAAVAAASAASDAQLFELLGDSLSPESLALADSLRQLRDPTLRPLLTRLTSLESWSQRRIGILGLAELESPPRIDSVQLARIGDAVEFAALVGEAFERDLLPTDQVRGMLDRVGLNPTIELRLRARLSALGDRVDPERIRELIKDKDMVGAMTGALVLAHQGDGALLEELTPGFIALPEPKRGAYAGVVLAMINSDKFQNAGFFFRALAEAYAGDADLEASVLRAWLITEPKTAGPALAAALVRQTELSGRLRLSLIALDAAEKLEPSFFEKPLAEEANPIVVSILSAGRAISIGEGIEAALAAMLEHDYTPCEIWAIDRSKAWNEDRAAGAMQVILAQAAARSHSESVRETLPGAAERLVLKRPALLDAALRAAVAEEDRKLTHGLLLGMLRAGAAPSWNEAPPMWPDAASQALALLIEARSADPYGESDPRITRLRDVALGLEGRLPPILRVQAAWLVFKHEGRSDEVLARVLAETR